MKARDLFAVRPDQIIEHPPELYGPNPPAGPITDYKAYAPQWWDGNAAEVIGPFNAEIMYQILEDGTQLAYIPVPGDRPAKYFYKDGTKANSWDPGVPCWYQSGLTLRFIKK